MTTIFKRSATVLVALAFALCGFAGVASAQGDYTPGAPQVTYEGPFPSSLALNPVIGALGFQSINPQPTAGAAGSGSGVIGGTGGGLAVTGSNVNLPVVAAISLIGVGGVVLVAARRRDA
jgi:hypothetical protein